MFNSYFSGDYILSKKALINVVFSDRSDGKTFDCKYRSLRDYKEKKNITVYLRRFKTEITDKLYNSFFDEVLIHEKYRKEFEGFEFKGNKKGVQVRVDGGQWDWIVLFVPLTMSGKLKSQISEVHRIETIDYDEFIPLDNRYIKDEMTLLLEFWKSIDRDRDKVQLIILGNKITPFNPLFDYFGLDLSIEGEKIRTYKNGALAVQIYANKEHREKRKESRFNELVKGTSYEDYEKGGILRMFDIQLKSREGFQYMYSFLSERGKGSLWYKEGQVVVSTYSREDGICITDKIYKIEQQQFMCTYARFGITLKSIYRRGDMFFEDNKSSYTFEPILKKVCAL